MAYRSEFLPTPLPPLPVFLLVLSIDPLLESSSICFAVLGVKPKTTQGRKEQPQAIFQLFLLLSCHFMYCLILLVDNFIKCILIIWTSPTPLTYFPTHLSCPKKLIRHNLSCLLYCWMCGDYQGHTFKRQTLSLLKAINCHCLLS